MVQVSACSWDPARQWQLIADCATYAGAIYEMKWFKNAETGYFLRIVQYNVRAEDET